MSLRKLAKRSLASASGGADKGLETSAPHDVGRRPTASAVARSPMCQHRWAQRAAAAHKQWRSLV